VPLARPIAEALRRGAIIVAASPRAARVLQRLFAEEQRAEGHTFWPSPAIADWDSWLRGLWRDHAFSASTAPILLTGLQERTLWTRIQREDDAPVLSRESMAALAMEAWSLLSAYNAHSARRSAWTEIDAERFRQWAAAFDRECSSHGWLSAGQLESSLAHVLHAPSHIALPPEVMLVGFDRLTPAQDAFLAAVEARGVGVGRFSPEPAFPTNDSPVSAWIAADDQRDEISACAHWPASFSSRIPTAVSV